jgi:tetratricopeptide (TPR) repeat protein
MTREQLTWAGGGLVLGFVGGFLVAYVMLASPVGGPAMPSSMPPPSSQPAGAPQAQQAPQAGDPHQDVMSILEELKGHLEIHPESIPTLLQLSEIYLQAGMVEQALVYLDRVEENEPGNLQGNIFRAMASERAGDSDETLELIERMQADHPEAWEPDFLMANFQIRHRRDLALAREALDRVEAREANMDGTAALRQELQRLESQPPPDEKGPR